MKNMCFAVCISKALRVDIVWDVYQTDSITVTTRYKKGKKADTCCSLCNDSKDLEGLDTRGREQNITV